MKLNINWKAGILSGVVVAIAGMAFFFFIGSQMHFDCKNMTNPSRAVNADIAGLNPYLPAGCPWSQVSRRIILPPR